MVRDRQFLTLSTWKCASRHNGVHFFKISTFKNAPKLKCFFNFDFDMCFAPSEVQFFISHLPRWLRARLFSEPTFQPPEPQIIKNRVFHNFSTFSRTCIFCLLPFSSLVFFLLTLPTSAFPSVHIVGSLTFKLPSTSYLPTYLALSRIVSHHHNLSGLKVQSS